MGYESAFTIYSFVDSGIAHYSIRFLALNICISPLCMLQSILGNLWFPPVKTRRWECDRPGVEPTSSGLHVWGQYHSSEKVSCDEWYWNPSPDIPGYTCGARRVVRGLLLTTPPEPPVLPFNIHYWYWYCQYRVKAILYLH